MAHSENVREVGFVTSARRYVLFIEGLPSAQLNDLIVDESGNRAIVRALSDTHVMALALDPTSVRAGARYALPKETYRLSIGEHLFGRVVNALCEPIDGKGPFPSGGTPFILDKDAPGIESRLAISEQLYTGATLVDTLLPIAKGQRQLIFGGDHAGKTSFLVDVVRYQRQTGIVCIYALIGKTLSELNRVAGEVLADGAESIVLSALSDQSPSRIVIAPAVAFLMAEYFQSKGRDVLVILDDLDAHAKFLREVSLLEERLPGREAYPGDLFYQQAHLMERSGVFADDIGGGSITTLPVVATSADNFSGIVPTNLMSCTDGHLMFLPELQAEGVYPAIGEQRSVTRVGRSAQTLTQKQLSMEVRLLLGRYRQLREYAEFGAELKGEVRAALNLGAIIEDALHQVPGETYSPDTQAALLTLALTSFFHDRDLAFFRANRARIIEALANHAELEDVRAASKAGQPLDAFRELLEKKHDFFTSLCHG